VNALKRQIHIDTLMALRAKKNGTHAPAEPPPAPVAQAVTVEPPTVDQMVFQCACSLPQPFTREDLVVACWRAFPERFGLKGFKDQYPDANRVYSAMSKSHILGWRLRQLGGGRYEVVEARP
jgi:hypothetical protein